MKSYTFKVYKTIESNGTQFFFSHSAYKTMLADAVRYDLDIDFWLYIEYCDAFEVL